MKTTKENAITIAIVDDHKLFRSGIVTLIHSLSENYSVTVEAANGQELLTILKRADSLPDIAILDIDMPVMNGYETAAMLRDLYPSIRVLVITMAENEQTLIRMLKRGIKGYLSKDVEPQELKQALHSIASKGYHYTDYLTGTLIEAVQDEVKSPGAAQALTDRELRFLELACSEYTYKEIADLMCLSIKTIDGYRNALFEKLDVKSRVGLALYAIKHKLVLI